jgi:hypothetical protein
MRRALLLAALFVAALFVASLGHAADTTRPYVVLPGESCWSISEKLFGDPRKYVLLHKLNNLGPEPHVLTPGLVLRVPGNTVGADALVVWKRNAVKTKAPASPEWEEARVDSELWRLYRVRTEDAASAGIKFEDQTAFNLRENALLVIYGGSGRGAAAQPMQRANVTLERGTLAGGLAAMDAAVGRPTAAAPPPPLVVTTPSSRVVARSTDLQIEVDDTDASIVSVHEGDASVSAQGMTVAVPADFGTVVEKGAAPQKPEPLPPPPTWSPGTESTAVVVAAGGSGAFEARWEPVARAKRYRVELARDHRFRHSVVDAVVGAGVQRFKAQDLPPGTYFARVAALDARRLEGRASKALTVTVVEAASSRPLFAAEGGVLESVGLVALRLPPGIEQALDDGQFVPSGEPMVVVGPGKHRVRSRPIGATTESVLTVTILAVHAELSVPTTLDPAEPPVPVTLTLRDERGRPAVVPGVSLLLAPGGPVPLTPSGAGVFTGVIGAPREAEGGRIAWSVCWSGGNLAEGVIGVASMPSTVPAPPPPPGFAWDLSPIEFAWREPDHPSVAIGGTPTTRAGITTRIIDGPLIAFSAAGELAVADGRLGLELDVPWLVEPLTQDPVLRDDIGDIRFGIRGLAVAQPEIWVTPSLRVTAPSGARADGASRLTVVDVGAGFGFRASPRWTLASSQALRLATSFADTTYVAWAGSATVSASLVAGLTFLVQVDAEAGTTALSGPASAMAGAALRWELDRVRLSVHWGAALGSAASDRLGAYTVGLSVDLGFGAL